MFNPDASKQPAEATYPVEKLYLFKRFTRATYLVETKSQAPTWDPAKRIKRWFDPNALGVSPETVMTYKVVGLDLKGNPVINSLTMTAKEACSVNLPGVMSFPKYVPMPTNAVMYCSATNDWPAGNSAVNVDLLCLKEEAEALASEIGGTKVLENEFFGGPCTINWADEKRRNWLVEWNGDNLQASALLKAKYMNGVGAPGKWILDRVATPVWQPEYIKDAGMQDPRPEILNPIRNLYPNEKLVSGFGGVVSVMNTSLASAAQAPSPAGSVNLPDLSKDVKDSLEILKEIKALLTGQAS